MTKNEYDNRKYIFHMFNSSKVKEYKYAYSLVSLLFSSFSVLFLLKDMIKK